MSTAISQWFYIKNEKQFGPVTDAELRQLASTGQISISDKVWKEGMKAWVNAGNLKGLFKPSAVPSPPPILNNPSSPPPLPSSDNLQNNLESKPPALPPTISDPFPPGLTLTNSSKMHSEIKLSQKSLTTDFTESNFANSSESNQSHKTSTPSTILEKPGLVVPIGKITLDASADAIDKVTGLSLKKELLDQLKNSVGVQQWEQVLGIGLKPESILFYCKINQAVFTETQQSGLQGVSGFFKGVKDKVTSTLQQANVIKNNRFLIMTQTKWYFAGQLAFEKQALALNPSDYKIIVNCSDSQLVIELYANTNSTQIANLSINIDLSDSNLSECNGNMKLLVENWLLEKSRNHRGETPSAPICVSASNSEFSTFLLPEKNLGPGWVTLRKKRFRFFTDKIEFEILFSNIVYWSCLNDIITIIQDTATGIQQFCFHAARSGVDSNTKPITVTSTNSGLGETTKTSSEEVDENKKDQGISRYTFNKILEVLTKDCQHLKCNSKCFVAELDVRSVFSETEKPIAIAVSEKKCETFIGDEPIRSRLLDNKAIAYELSSGCYLQISSGCIYRVRISEECRPVWRLICQLTSTNKSLQSLHGILGEIGSPDDSDFKLVRISLDDSGVIQFKEGQDLIYKTNTRKVSEEGKSWSSSFGTIGFDLNESKEISLTTSIDSILSIWKNKELCNLHDRISGVNLGKLYEEFNEKKTEKVLTGLFGIFLITQQQLESNGLLEDLKEEINRAPAGPLSDELNEKLVQKLSILELSKQKISRWFDRCSLFLPHFMAEQEREWLNSAFGSKFLDNNKKDKEARRIHQIIRSELRQIQVSLNRPLQELSQNLNQLSFAFPEEVKNPALASIRNAASLAEKGAILAAFGGVGAQLLMGVGRASMGDPFAIAMLGSTGLSLVGKHLQQKAREKEQDIKLRGYGIQALKWWDVVLDSAFVMALECQQNLDSLHQSGQDRDRRIMEGLQKDQLPIVQRQMVQSIKRWLTSSLENQFCEILPGSGLFGHHLAKRICKSVNDRSVKVIREFGFDFPVISSKEIL